MLNAVHKSYKLLRNQYAIREQKRYMDVKEEQRKKNRTLCTISKLNVALFFRSSSVISLNEKISTGNNRWNVSALCMAEPSSLLLLLLLIFFSFSMAFSLLVFIFLCRAMYIKWSTAFLLFIRHKSFQFLLCVRFFFLIFGHNSCCFVACFDINVSSLTVRMHAKWPKAFTL